MFHFMSLINCLSTGVAESYLSKNSALFALQFGWLTFVETSDPFKHDYGYNYIINTCIVA